MLVILRAPSQRRGPGHHRHCLTPTVGVAERASERDVRLTIMGMACVRENQWKHNNNPMALHPTTPVQQVLQATAWIEWAVNPSS